MIAQREAHRAQGGGGGGGGPPGSMGGGMGMGPGPGSSPMVNIPPSLLNNPNIPNEIIHGLQAGKIGSTVFVANVSCKCGIGTNLVDLCSQSDKPNSSLFSSPELMLINTFCIVY